MQDPYSGYEPERVEYSPSQPVMVQLPSAPVRATWVFMAINVIMFVVCILKGMSVMGSSENDALVLIELGAKWSPLMDIGGEWWRLLTATVLHGGLVHIGFNMYALYALGPTVERFYGSLLFSVIYLIAGIGGAWASYTFGDLRGPSIGASGAIFGLIGCLIGFFLTARSVLGDFARQNLRQMVGTAAINLIIGLSLSSVIDNYAHIGGMVMGLALGYALAPRLAYIADWFKPRIEARAPAPIRWLSVVAALIFVVGATWFVHTQRMADSSSRALLENFYQAWIQSAR